MNKNLFKQFDSRWGSKLYPCKGSYMSGSGCGCVSCTHIVIEQAKYANYTPENLRPWMVKQGFAVYKQGTTWNGITKTLEHYGYKVVHIGSADPMSKAWKELDKGNRIGIILFLSGKGPNGTVWTAGGHYVAFTDYYKKDNKHYFYTKDSGGRNNDSVKKGYFSYENSMRGVLYQMWIVEKIDTPKEQSTTTKKTSESTTLKVDGSFGQADVKALQKIFKTTEDGLITGQLAKLKPYHKGFNNSIKYGVNGSYLVKAIQKYSGFSGKDLDGQLGPITIKAFQKKIDATQSGVWDTAMSKSVQTWVNQRNKSKTTEKTKTTTTTTTKKKTKGIDISAYQSKVSVDNFKKAKKDGVNFVILRLGYTGSKSKKPTIDSVFENNYKNAIAAGLPVGIYYYSLATTAEKAKQEAEFCIKNLKDKKISFPVYIDVEDPNFQSKASKSALAAVCDSFCKTIKAAGYTPGVYASLAWFNNKIGNITASHTKWVAQYYKECQYTGKYDMWQYSSSGSVNGIPGRIDMNYWYK